MTGGTQRLRLAELMAALSLATDLGMGQPLEQALRTCLLAIELAARMGLAKDEISEVFYVALLRFIGCTVDAHELAEIFGGDDIASRRASALVVGGSPVEIGRELLKIGAGQGAVRRIQLFARLPGALPRAGDSARAHCEMATHLALRLELPAAVQRSLGDEAVRWDGLGAPKGFSRNDIPISGRIVLVARDVEVLHRAGGIARVRSALKSRSGHAYDPAVAGAMLERTADASSQGWLARSGADALTETQKRSLLGPRVRGSLNGLSSFDAIRPIRERFDAKAWERSHLNWMSYADLNLRLPELLLMRVDKMAMGVSLEGRVPFLDHKFVELAMSIPAEVKVRNGTLKYILKKAVRGVIPDELIDRPKQGFGVPVYEWLFDRLGGTARRAIDGFCARTDIFDRREALRLVDEREGLPTWIVLNFALWHKHFIERESIAIDA